MKTETSLRDNINGNHYVDLHMHSYKSDGIFSPEEVVRRASDAGLKAMSLTDHDTVDGLEEATEAGERLGVEVIPGIELSVTKAGKDIHMLGYFLDFRNKDILDRLSLLKVERRKRVVKMVEKLNALGVDVKFEAVLKQAGGESLGRPHVASALVEGGFVSKFEDAFRTYIGNNGPAYVLKYKITAREGIDMLHAAGGVTIIAHPALYHNNQIVNEMIEEGVDGVEVIHPKHSQGERNRYENIVRQHGLLRGGGSDSHGDREHDTLIGSEKVPYEFLTKMREWLRKNEDAARVTTVG